MNKQSISNEDRLSLYQNIINNIPQAIILASETGLVDFNKSAIDILGANDEADFKAVVKNQLFNSDDFQRAIKDFLYAWQNIKLGNCEYELIRKDGSIIPIEVSYRKIDGENQPNFMVISIQDITKRKIDERALRKAKERAEIADKLKTSFLANMSHEIRTPINSVIGFADLLNDDDLTDEERHEYINIIHVNGELLLKLINDIIDIAKIESGQLKIIKSDFSLSDLFEEIQLTQSGVMKAMEKGNLELSYTISDDLKESKINSDQFRLVQVISNLINNAFKFTSDGFIRYGVRKESDSKLLFWVEDSGVGIPDEDIDLIFERFGQVEKTLHMNQFGTGLGLSISKKIVNLLGGKIWVESSVNVGSKFIFTIEAHDLNMAKSTMKAEKYDFKGKTILIVEDIESNYQLVDILLKKNGASTIWAQKGYQALEICKNNKNHIDLILMDINLPDIDGYSMTTMIKEFKPNMPIIAHTAYAMAGEKQKSIEFGCDDYVSKPINPELFYKTINKYL